MKQNKNRKAWVSIDYNIRVSTLYKNDKGFDTSTQMYHLKRSCISRNLKGSNKLREEIEAYLFVIWTPLTIKDICSHLLSEIGLAIP